VIVIGKGVSMAKYDSTSLRNVAIIGHGGTGKTSLCEAFLFTAGKTDCPAVDLIPDVHQKMKLRVSGF
jgi:translation elongation factor EF-G